ncbi:hypothetical protein H7U16_25970 [Klebsiella pneumoniae]|uniref:Uncharacterized protein n=1 Tax=Klebsiella pneumoniae TaxID=573 RepID=A0A7X1LN98_KLEPN|nr:hypothetical protein [Klebsiella pneumoniae]
MRTVQAYAHPNPYERGRFGQALEGGGSRRAPASAQAAVTAARVVLVFGAIVLVLWSGAHVITGTMSAGTLGQFVLALIGGGSVRPGYGCGTNCGVRPAAWGGFPNCCRNGHGDRRAGTHCAAGTLRGRSASSRCGLKLPERCVGLRLRPA